MTYAVVHVLHVGHTRLALQEYERSCFRGHVLCSYGFEFVHANVVYGRTHRHKQSCSGSRWRKGRDWRGCSVAMAHTSGVSVRVWCERLCLIYKFGRHISRLWEDTHIVVSCVEREFASRLQYVCVSVGIASILRSCTAESRAHLQSSIGNCRFSN